MPYIVWDMPNYDGRTQSELKSQHDKYCEGIYLGVREARRDIVRMLREAASKEGLHQKNNLVDELADEIERLP